MHLYSINAGNPKDLNVKYWHGCTAHCVVVFAKTSLSSQRHLNLLLPLFIISFFITVLVDLTHIPPLISTCTSMRPSGFSHLKARLIITLWKTVCTCEKYAFTNTVNRPILFGVQYLQLICINTDNVKDERGDENVNWGRRAPELGEDLLRWEVAWQHSCSESSYCTRPR